MGAKLSPNPGASVGVVQNFSNTSGILDLDGARRGVVHHLIRGPFHPAQGGESFGGIELKFVCGQMR